MGVRVMDDEGVSKAAVMLRQLGFVRQCVISSLSVNALPDKADITHWRIDGQNGQSGDDGGSFLRMIRHAAWSRTNRFGVFNPNHRKRSFILVSEYNFT